MSNFSPQHLKVQAWSQLRARIRSAWNDLFYSDRPEHENPVPDSRSCFTLRKLLAGVWVIAAFTFTAREDITTVFAVGMPLAVLGYAYLSGLRLGCLPQGVLWSWLVISWFICYQLPYMHTPVPLPASAHHVRSSGGWGLVLFRFEAPVEDCIRVAEEHRKKSRFSADPLLPMIIDRAHGLRVPDDVMGTPRRTSWMDLQNINRGLHYQINYTEDIWIDTERGIFYFRWYD